MTHLGDNPARRAFLRGLFDAAVAAARPGPAVAALLADGVLCAPAGRTVVVGAGKGSADMARAIVAGWTGPVAGLVAVAPGQVGACGGIELVESSHPLPDARGVALSRRMLDMVAGLGPHDLVVALVSGGASAMLPAPGRGMSIGDEIALNRALLRSGLRISEMNAIRKQVSRIKGGRLARAAAPAPVVTLVLSDIPGDDPALVGSGPTLADPASRQDARDLVARHGIDLPGPVSALLASDDDLPPMPQDPVFAANRSHLVGSARVSLDAAAALAERAGIRPIVLSDAIEGEAAEVARAHAGLVREVLETGAAAAMPVVLLSGGETTVTLGGASGKGGRNMEYMLALAIALDGAPDVTAIACDTDGIDGSEPYAGALIDPGTLERMRGASLDPAALLAAHDSWSGFAAVNDLVETGPTGTNVNDFRAILVGPLRD